MNPKPFLKSLIDRPVSVRLKWNKTEYRGTLLSVDNYMNLQVDDAVEYIDGKEQGRIGEIFIRCNNVLFIGESVPEDAGDEEEDGSEEVQEVTEEEVQKKEDEKDVQMKE